MKKITLVYEYHARTLEQLIIHRKNYASDSVRVSNLSVFFNILKRIDEEDVIGAMRDLVNGLKSFRNNNQHHSDVQPSNVFVLDNKTFKLADACLMNDEQTGYERKFNEMNYRTPLGPQALDSLFMQG